ncbi:uncharacterized protein [Rutidosis leptorrhynchoides]|uniref:uncharacterized protein n=1 Tax=Rutidosis leptorrhynchoides TaxID=125765 RepID=UPI003A9A5B63
MSKLDRFLATDNFINLWEDLSNIALDRRLSDHCPLVLRDKLIDYGSKPFKIFDVLFKEEGVVDIIKEAWNVQIRASDWEIKVEIANLNENDRKEWLECRRKWIEKENIKSRMLKQKARIWWILEGDENSNFFHNIIHRKHNKTNLRGIHINGVWSENPEEVKEAVFCHFKSIFQATDLMRPLLPGWSDYGSPPGYR